MNLLNTTLITRQSLSTFREFGVEAIKPPKNLFPEMVGVEARQFGGFDFLNCLQTRMDTGFS
jgi:hypothetical protein